MAKLLTTREIAEAAVAIALAFILSMIKIFEAPMGGSITAGSMIPILLLALRRGYKLGTVAAVFYGVLQILEHAFIVHPAQAILDYPLAFGALGLAGFFSPKTKEMRSTLYAVLGVIVGITGRYVCHFFSGVIFFYSYAPEGMSPWVYSALYNAFYLVPEMIISVVLISILVKKGILEFYR